MAQVERIVSSDGHAFDVRIVGSGRTVLLLPAMGVRASYYDDFADQFAAEGFRVATCDLRGHGSSSARPARGVDFDYRDVLERDLPAVHAFLGPEVSIAGHSLGGQLGLIYSGLSDIDRVAIIACCIPDYRGFEGGFGRGVHLAGYLFPAIARLVGHFPGGRVGFAGRESRGVISDWARSVRTGDYAPEWEAALKAVQGPVLAVEVAGDTWAPARAIRRLTDKCVSAEIVSVRVDCQASRPHFGWVREARPAIEELSGFFGM